MPTIYLTNAASVAAVARGNAKPETAACVGPGPVLSIMRFPREEMGEAGTGRVLSLTPPQRLAAPAIAAKKAHDRGHTEHCKARLKWGDGECECGAGDAETAAAWRAYEEALRAIWEPYIDRAFAPGVLTFGRPAQAGSTTSRTWDGQEWERVGEVPDGATLICACSREAAGAGRCHRVIAADMLKRAGWSVVLDGRNL
jgi:hypothetical protein